MIHALNRAYKALKIIRKLNRIRNDKEAYIHDLIEWGIYERHTEPDPEDFGLDESIRHIREGKLA